MADEETRSAADQIAHLVSEARNPASMEIDRLDTAAMLAVINREDHEVAPAIGRVLPQIALAVDAIAGALHAGGRLIYVGAGTSGRLGVLDASECPPTFGVSEGVVVGLIAGGARALTHAVEGAEDDAAQGAADLAALALTPNDIVVGIAASGRTPYVLGALSHARASGCRTVALTCNPGSALAALADIAIEPSVGPEVLTGSTRMKSGTAQKLVLNMLSTGTMIRIGKTFGNLMIDIQPGNRKLAARAARIVAEATGCTPERAETLLAHAGAVKTAILMELAGIDAETASQRLARAGGVLRAALDG